MTLTVLKTLSISIIIPTLNEETTIGSCLDSLAATAVSEILVVDGGSTDKTVQEVTQRGHCCLSSSPGRGRQQHAGAVAATGNILLFLHSDSRLPPDFCDVVAATLQEDSVAAGAFRLAIDAPGMCFRLIERGANLRSRLLRLPYGDQGFFLYRMTYFDVGGFPDQPLLEDVSLVGKLKHQGEIALVPSPVTTSVRRWRSRGIVRTTVINQLMLIGWRLGISPQRLARWYYGKD